MRIGIVVATYWEVRSFIKITSAQKTEDDFYRIKGKNKELYLAISGIGKKNAVETTKKLLQISPHLVLSTGFAGSLKPEIQVGDLVCDSNKSTSQKVEIVSFLCKKLQIPLYQGSFFTSDHLLRTTLEKEEISKETTAIAVDMESSAIFEVSSSSRVPCLFLRAISDGFRQTLPVAVAKFYSCKSLSNFFVEVLASPADWLNWVQFVMSLRLAEKNLTKFLVEFYKEI